MKCNLTRQSATWPHGHSRPILFPHSAKRVRDCRQNIPWLLWNALLTTPYVSEHYKYMFLVARDLYEMFVLWRGKHTTRRSTVGIWSEVRVYRTPATYIPWAGGLYLGKFPDNRRLMFNIHFFEHFLQISHNLINGQNNMSGEKTRQLETLTKLFQAMRSRTICWQDYRTTY